MQESVSTTFVVGTPEMGTPDRQNQRALQEGGGCGREELRIAVEVLNHR